MRVLIWILLILALAIGVSLLAGNNEGYVLIVRPPYRLELSLNLLLILVGLAFAAMLGSYSPDDPGWMVATDEPAKNLLGRFGAAVSSTLVILIGRGAWTVPLILFAWGLRFALHRGGERALARVVFAVIAVALWPLSDRDRIRGRGRAAPVRP